MTGVFRREADHGSVMHINASWSWAYCFMSRLRAGSRSVVRYLKIAVLHILLNGRGVPHSITFENRRPEERPEDAAR